MAVGIDLVNVNRIKEDEAFVSHILAEEERDAYYRRSDKKIYLASRWAIKEAFIKALGKGVSYDKIIVCNEVNGKPYIKYGGQVYKGVSVSHEKDYSVAIVIVD
ncbi:MAG: holo-ACP synthase [Coprobacillus sp.]|nr:holo-ACP synthase [Coprobacillus sp.]